MWFSLATHGVSAYRTAIERGLDLARAAADRVRARGPPVELVMEPTLSVVPFLHPDTEPAVVDEVLSRLSRLSRPAGRPRRG